MTSLAIHGGTPVRKERLPYGHHEVREEDLHEVIEVLRSSWLTTGPRVEEFEQAVAKEVGAQFAVAFSSGTAALHGAVFAAGVGPGDEVITTPMTFCATANSVVYQGARPVFCDVSEDTLNLDPERLQKVVTARTRAILPVDYAGHPADLDPILKFAEEHRLLVIEDAAHALGATYRDRPIGSISHMTVFSFHPVKHITTGEGGMVVTNRPEFVRTLRLFRNQGIDQDLHQRESDGSWTYEMVTLGYNYRLSDVGCALGLSQLRRLSSILSRRRSIAHRYAEALSCLNGVRLPTVRPEAEPAWHLYPIRLDPSRLTADRGQIYRALRAEGLGVNVHYIPVTWHPFYRERFGHRDGDFPVAEEAYRRLLTLPLFHGMSDQDVEDCIVAVTKVIQAYAC